MSTSDRAQTHILKKQTNKQTKIPLLLLLMLLAHDVKHVEGPLNVSMSIVVFMSNK